MGKVEVSRGLLIGLGTTLLVAVLALVYLLGRASGQARLNATPGAPPVLAGSPSAPGTHAAAPPALVPAEPSSPAPLGGSQATPASPGVGSTLPADPARAVVAAYFEAVDHLAPGQLGGDPESVAREMLAGLVKGDTSGFDRMIAQAEAGRRRLAALSPPPPCASYHRDSLASLDESLAVMRSMKHALEGSEAESSLTALGTRANALRGRAEALQQEEKALRQRYGLAR